MPQVKAWALAHMGKATADIDYTLDTPDSAFTNPTIAPRLHAYTERAREVHGADYDPSTQDFDGRVVMEVGGGRKHGRLWLGDSAIDSGSVGRLSEIRAREPSGSQSIRQRPSADQMEIATLKVISVCFVFY